MLNLLIGIAIFQCTFFAVFLVSGKRRKNYSNRFLSFLLISLVIAFIDHYYQANFNVLEYPQYLFVFNFSAIFTTPILLLYTKSTLDPNFRFSSKNILYFVPGFSFILFFIFDYHILSFEEKIHYIQDIPANYLVAYFIPIFGNLLSFAFVIQCMRLVYGVSSQLSRKQIPEIKHIRIIMFLLLSLLIFFITTAFNILFDEILHNAFAYEYVVIAEVFSWFAFSIVLIYHGLTTPGLFLPQMIKIKYEKSVLKESDKHIFRDRLNEYMLIEQPFLNPKLNLNSLSQKTNIPPKYLSQIINEEKGLNFFDYINYYRVENVKQRLNTGEHHSRVILSIALDAGFNSKAAFNRAFKKNTGITPSQYIKSIK
ncbi:MAG: AraC family transcriptional regulator [Deferribacteres bacterium]|nr:AraC family transcriptional regulator [Deferribacteres bacterium]